MIVHKCDICGRIEGLKTYDDRTKKKKSLKFSEYPFKTTVKNICGEDYEVFVYVTTQKKSDSVRIETASKNLLKLAADRPVSDIEEKLMASINLENPNPSICDDCKLKMAKDVAISLA